MSLEDVEKEDRRLSPDSLQGRRSRVRKPAYCMPSQHDNKVSRSFVTGSRITEAAQHHGRPCTCPFWPCRVGQGRLTCSLHPCDVEIRRGMIEYLLITWCRYYRHWLVVSSSTRHRACQHIGPMHCLNEHRTIHCCPSVYKDLPCCGC
jgi:hypothetical protein